jgi:hypothetical protein
MPNGKFMNCKNLRPAIQDGASVILRSTEKGAALCEQQSVLAGQSLAGTDPGDTQLRSTINLSNEPNLGLGQ